MNEVDLFIESLNRTDPAERAAFVDCEGRPRRTCSSAPDRSRHSSSGYDRCCNRLRPRCSVRVALQYSPWPLKNPPSPGIT